MLLTSNQLNSLLLLRDTISLEATQSRHKANSSPSQSNYQIALDSLELRRLQSMIDPESLCRDIGKAGHQYFVRASIILDQKY